MISKQKLSKRRTKPEKFLDFPEMLPEPKSLNSYCKSGLMCFFFQAEPAFISHESVPICPRRHANSSHLIVPLFRNISAPPFIRVECVRRRACVVITAELG